MILQKQPSEIDPPLLALFRSELLMAISLLQKNFKEIQSGQFSPEIVEKLLDALRPIKGAARILQFGSISALMNTFDEYFRIHDLSIEAVKNQLPLFFQIINQLQNIARLDDSSLVHILSKDNELEEQIKRIKVEIKNCEILHQKSGEKKIETKEIESIATVEESTSDVTMMNFFRAELENQTHLLNEGLIALEQNPGELQIPQILQVLLRATHSLKGAAKVVELSEVVYLTHKMEDCFVAAQKKKLILDDRHIDILLKALDLLSTLSHLSHAAAKAWLIQEKIKIDKVTNSLESILAGNPPPEVSNEKEQVLDLKVPRIFEESLSPKEPKKKYFEWGKDRELRVKAESLTHLMGLAGDSMVESRWLNPFNKSLERLKRKFCDLSEIVEALNQQKGTNAIKETTAIGLKQIERLCNECRINLGDRLTELEHFINNHSNLSSRLYREVIDSRMRAFGEGVEGFPRMVRDLARQLNKKVRLEIYGKSTPVDRDILEKLEAPLAHLIRNAIDHGIELPEVRIAQGKPAEGNIRLEAQHKAGMLSITVTDDGKGLDLEKIKSNIISKGLIKPELGKKLSESELIDFLFLPGFSTINQVTELSGRGVGLNVVQNVIQEISGSINVSFIPNKGVTFNLQMPLTLSVIHALIVEISKEPYAFPLNRIERAFFISRENIELLENRQYFKFNGQNIGLISGWQVLGLNEVKITSVNIPVVIVADRFNSYGIIVDRFLGEKELVVQELDSRLGKVADISSGAFMEDGSPILAIDVEDIVRSIDKILSEGSLSKVTYGKEILKSKKTRKVLVVDDSVTVREVECRLLRNHGYEVTSAINGVDAWNVLRMGNYDLVITDIDMPRMNGIELLRSIKADPRLKGIPVMIVSYKEGDEDRLEGLESGASYFLTKSSFHDLTLLTAVTNLIGKAI